MKMISASNSISDEKREQQELIEQQTRLFLARGGQIQQMTSEDNAALRREGVLRDRAKLPGPMRKAEAQDDLRSGHEFRTRRLGE